MKTLKLRFELILLGSALLFFNMAIADNNNITLVKSGSGQMNKQATNYAGMWVTSDGHIRHQLLSNGRYDEARGNRESAYQGRYEINNNHINYWDDTGFTADGIFVNANTLHHAGMIFYRQP